MSPHSQAQLHIQRWGADEGRIGACDCESGAVGNLQRRVRSKMSCCGRRATDAVPPQASKSQSQSTAANDVSLDVTATPSRFVDACVLVNGNDLQSVTSYRNSPTADAPQGRSSPKTPRSPRTSTTEVVRDYVRFIWGFSLGRTPGVPRGCLSRGGCRSNWRCCCVWQWGVIVDNVDALASAGGASIVPPRVDCPFAIRVRY